MEEPKNVWGEPVAPPVIDATPIVKPEPPAGPPVETQKPSFKGLLVRAGGDRVYLIREGKKYWMTSPEALEKNGFKLGDEKEIDQVSLSIFPEGTPIR
jgi:hypothetical protein